MVFVHGGGRVIDRVAEAMGVKQRYVVSVSGFKSRLTNEDTLNVFKMVIAGKINKEIVAEFIKRDVLAIGLSGVDGKLVEGVRKERIKIIDERGRKRFIYGDLSGRPANVNASLLMKLLDENYLPVVSPIGISSNGEIINLDGDRVAACIASAMKAEKLCLFTDVEGLMINGELVREVSGRELSKYIELAESGMKRKLLACREAIEGGVREVVISSGLIEKPVENALLKVKCTIVRGE